jgi:hypothetical protein
VPAFSIAAGAPARVIRQVEYEVAGEPSADGSPGPELSS